MEDKRNPFSSSNSDYHTDANNTNENNGTNHEQSESGKSSYYYAYGPYQSTMNNETKSTTSTDAQGAVEDVQVTQPNPVKPMPFSSATRQSYANYGPGGTSNNGNGGSAGPNGANWQYNQRPEKKRSSVRTFFIGFLASAILIPGLMFTADYTNLFTGNDTAQSTTSGSAQTVVDKTTSDVPFPSGTASVEDVVKSASPAVVKIETFTSKTTSTENSWMNDPFFSQFFGDSYNRRNQSSESDSSTKELTPLGIGTGFIFDKEGYILTNNHVIEGGESVQVTIEGYEKPLTATVLGTSSELDLAVLKVEGEGDFPTVSLGDSDATAVGAQVVAIGNPSGFDHTVTSGWLSAKDRSIDVNDNGTAKKYENLLQTDAAINSGNSGGPLLNMKGEVIGMNTAVSTTAQGIGFAIPSNIISNVVDDLKANKEIPKEPVPFIGATLYTMTEDMAKQIGISQTEGALVYNVVFGSPAYDAELRAYDLITAVDGKKITTKEELIEAVQAKQVGDKISLTVVRNSKTADVSVTIGDKNQFQTTNE